MSFHFHPQAKMAPSSMYMPSEELAHSLVLCRSAAVYMTDSTSETGDPWGVPTVKSNGSDILLLNRSLTEQSLRKEWHQPTISGGKPRSESICTNLLWLTLSKNPWMSKRRRPV